MTDKWVYRFGDGTADGDADSHEEQLIRRVSELLYVSHGDFIRAKLAALGE